MDEWKEVFEVITDKNKLTKTEKSIIKAIKLLNRVCDKVYFQPVYSVDDFLQNKTTINIKIVYKD